MDGKKIKVIVTGATGMVGEGVLYECLKNPAVESVLIVNRKPSGLSHPKLKEVLHADFLNLSAIEPVLTGYDACFFCLGVSSVGMSADDYYRNTYTLTLHVAETLARLNPHMTFCYVSGGGTDSTEKGRSRWARVKGKTENDLMKLPFAHVYNFRPGFMKPATGAKNTSPFYKYINWLYPLTRKLGGASRLSEVGLAMIRVTTDGYPKPILEIKDIIAVADNDDLT